MGETKPNLVRIGATVVLLVVVGAVLVWIIRGGHQRQRSGTLATPEQEAGGRVSDHSAQQQTVSPEDKRLLIGLARNTIEEVVRHGRLPEVDPSGLSSRLREKSGCFVTLEIKGQLRGCIGHIQPKEPLYEAVLHNARNAATRDLRFSPVTPEELSQIEVEVSVLTVPQPLSFDSPEDLLQKLQPHRDGVVLSVGVRRATFLPQVWEKLPDKQMFLGRLSTKAGLVHDGWRSPEAKVEIYHVEAFKESGLEGSGNPPGAASTESEN